MSIANILATCTERGIKVELDVDGENLRIRAPKGALTEDLRTRLAAHKADLVALLQTRKTSTITPDLENRYLPFPLADVQQAYVIGRDNHYGLGGPCQMYAEFSTGLDLERLERAWQRMIQRHEMLRTIIRPDFQQQILRPETVPPYRIEIDDLRSLSTQERNARLEQIRVHFTEGTRPLDKPLYDLRASLLPDGVRLHFMLELILVDVTSLQVLFGDWARLYEDPDRVMPPLTFSFRDHVLAEHAMRRGPEWERAVSYWKNRIPTLPGGPDLPRCREPESLLNPKIRKLIRHLSREQWQRLQTASAAAGITPSIALCAAWAEVLTHFSHNNKFLLNITTFRRLPVHPEVTDLIGDFTTTQLLEHDGQGSTFRERAQRLGEQLDRDRDHSRVSGIQVQRMRAPEGDDLPPAPAPLVFTSMLGHSRNAHSPFGWAFLGEPIYFASRTPQVWIDYQILEHDGALQISWDVTDELFPEGFMDAIFEANGKLVENLAISAEAWQSASPMALPAAQAEQRSAYNATSAPVTEETLFAGFLRHAEQFPDDPAVLTGHIQLSYGEVERRSRAIAQQLVATGAAAERLVAIVMPKGWEQVVAALAVVRAGAAYLPIDPDLPPDRIALLLQSGNVEIVLTTPELDASRIWPEGRRRMVVDASPPFFLSEQALPAVAPSQLAYVIYTSGSTGMPKGVMIEHRAAVNTIVDIQERFGIRRGDRVFALSSLSFDLSVYDVFGMLAAGGAIVLPSASDLRDPAAWVPLLRRASVTVWNSVPALLEMLVDYAGERLGIVPDTLRVVMLSGDWIPVKLPDRVRRFVPSVRIHSLGGATEASIWSITFPIDQVQADWRSIPYGRPMRNQRFYVLDDAFYDRPVWVTGELYIGGDGLARGYFADPVRTNERFLIHPRTGERLYKTGDLGRYLPDGNIEFLGRADTQIKLRGFRIELGEIEAALAQHPAIGACAVVPEGPARAPTHLAAYVVPRATSELYDMPEPPLGDIVTRAEKRVASTVNPSEITEETGRVINELIDKLVASYLVKGLLEIGVFDRPGVPWTEGDVLGKGILPRYQRWLRRSLDFLATVGVLERHDQSWMAKETLRPEPVAPLWKELLSCAGPTGQTLDLIRRTGENLEAIILGRMEAVEALFPGGANDETQRMYQASSFTESNAVCREIVTELAARGRPMRVLEIGAGVGSTTQHLLPVLSVERTRYLYTDISRYFLQLGQEKFGAYPYVEYGLFNAEQDPDEQGLETGAFHLVVGSSVLHATRDIRETLRHTRKVMQGGGVLLLIEETRFHSLHNMTMGLQQGFDRAEDAALRPSHPLLSTEAWTEELAAVGFVDIASYAPRDWWAVLLGVKVIVARLPRKPIPHVDQADVLAYLTARIPGYMVPAAIRVLEALPLSANGKVDRGALAKQQAAHVRPQVHGDERVAPSTVLERELAGYFSELLGVADIAVNDHFVALGGDSLLAARLCALVREKLGVDLSVRALFANPTVGKLAKYVTDATSAAQKTQSSSTEASAQHDYVAPTTPTEVAQASLWEQVLPGGPYGTTDDFFLVGGDDHRAAALIEAIERTFNVAVSMDELRQERTLEAIALLVEEKVLEHVIAMQHQVGHST